MVCRDSTCVVLMEEILNSAIAFEKEYKEKFVAARIVEIMKDMRGSDLLTEMSTQDCYRYICALNMMLKHESVIALVRTLNGDRGG